MQFKQILKKYGSYIRFVFSALFILLVLRKVEIASIIDSLSEIRLNLFFVVYSIMFSGVLFSSYKWQFILNKLGQQLPWRKSFFFYFTSISINILTPGTIGGDMTRAFMAKNYINNKGEEDNPSSIFIKSIIIDRVSGLVGLLVLGTLVFFFTDLPQTIIMDTNRDFLKISFVLVAFIITILLIFRKRVLEITFLKHFTHLFIDRLSLSDLTKILFLALIFQSMVILTNLIPIIMLVSSQGINIGLLTVFIAIVAFLSFLPISIQGLGVREYASLVLFPLAGVDETVAIIVALLLFVSSQILSITASLVIVASQFNRQEN